MSPPIDAIWRTSVAVMVRDRRACRQEHGLQIRRHRLVHAGHLHLVVEIGAVAQAADQDRGAMLARRVDHQTVEGDDLECAWRRRRTRASAACSISATRSSKENSGFLPGWMPIATIDRVGDRERRLQHVEMPVGQRVEGAGIDRDAFASWHRASSACVAQRRIGLRPESARRLAR